MSFIKHRPSSVMTSIDTIEKLISAGLMILHLKYWNLISLSKSNSIWFEYSNEPCYYITKQISLKGIPQSFYNKEKKQYLHPHTDVSLNDETESESESDNILTSILLYHSTSEIRNDILLLKPKWSWILSLDKMINKSSNFFLSYSLPSIEELINILENYINYHIPTSIKDITDIEYTSIIKYIDENKKPYGCLPPTNLPIDACIGYYDKLTNEELHFWKSIPHILIKYGDIHTLSNIINSSIYCSQLSLKKILLL